MSYAEKPVRSLLFVPALDKAKMEKALASGADALIIDLEGSIPPAAKPEARREATQFLAAYAQKPSRPRLYVRVNDLESGFCSEDLASVAPECPDGVLLPKARNGADAARLSKQLDALERYAGLKNGRVGVLPVIETPGALLDVNSFIGATPRLHGFSWGKTHLRTALGAASTRDGRGRLTGPYMMARSLCLIAAHAAGVQAIDCPHGDLKNMNGLAMEAQDAARDGFTAKLAIHPGQVSVINDAFTPVFEDIEEAAAILAAFEAQGNPGVLVFQGRMLHRPDLEHAQNVLARAGVSLARERTAAPLFLTR